MRVGRRVGGVGCMRKPDECECECECEYMRGMICRCVCSLCSSVKQSNNRTRTRMSTAQGEMAGKGGE